LRGVGGSGGGGNGYGQAQGPGTVGTANTGGGGGGGGCGYAGGSGVVAIRYSNTLPDATSTTGSPTFTNTGGYKIYKWTGNGSIIF
jgi:hypothetical protein